ncbi:TonB-dependent receptor domain-containing protein [Pantoea ananatis]|uniref:TonB-dependent receptor domain-containing protein n=1 Tax=Pantoea ananas TaxID=553 RepID=UPI003C1F3C5E
MSLLPQGSTCQHLFRVAVLSSAVHAACSYAANNNAASEPTMTVIAPKQQAGSKTTLTAGDLQRRGANDFGSIMRYEPLISATGAAGGSSAGKSGFDRSGYTGYNIRGLESNRVGLDIDGIPIPDATGRPYVSRSGNNTFGIGRDYIDPYMFNSVDIEKGATSVEQPNTAIGGNVSFHNKSPDDYLSSIRDSWLGYQSNYSSDDHSWHNGITAAAGDDEWRGLLVYSRRDGQQTRNNSDVKQAFPANWHSNAFMASGIWQPNDQHKLSANVDYYQKTLHSHYDIWDGRGNAVWGSAQQQSDTRRLGFNLADEWTPDSGVIDTLTTRVYWQQTQAHDNTYLPTSSGEFGFVYSDYNVDTYGFDTRASKTLGRHELSAGFNTRLNDTERPFRQAPPSDATGVITQPQSDSRAWTAAGYLQDKINFDLNNHNAAIIPGVRVIYQRTQPKDLGDLTHGSTVLTSEQVEKLYSKTNADTQLLPSLTLQYDVMTTLTTWIQYKRGVEFPTPSQLYGSWNLGASYAGSQQYALIGNTNLKTETSDNIEWGLKGQATKGITVNTSVFYNQYKNFIAYTRYRRATSPEMFVNVPRNIYTSFQAENRDKAYIYGAEISSKVEYGAWFPQVDGLSSTFALGYNQGKSKSSYLGDKYIDLDSVAPLKAILGLAWDDRQHGYGAALTATFVKGKQATATSRESYSNTGTTLADSTSEYRRVPGYGMVDATAYWQVAKNVRLSGGIYNLTNRKYWDYLSSRTLTSGTAQERNDINLSVMPGRTFQLGVNVDF